MLTKQKGKSNTPSQAIHNAYNHNARRIICISTALTALLCKISLQFCCEFIDNNRFNILLIRNVARLIKIPTSILYILHSAFTLQKLIEECKNPNGKKEVVKIVGKSANLVNSVIELLMSVKIIHFLAGNDSDIIRHIGLTSTILFVFISEPISYYYSFKKYNDPNNNPDESAKHRKALIINTLTFSLDLLNFILKRVETPTIPINLGCGIIYNFNLSVTVGIIYSAVFLMLNVEKLFNQPINGTDPSTTVDHAHTNGHVMNDGAEL
jgi:hypothetical protein